jgi:dTDP-4-dehydrorhamnose 3,5-epimerase
LLVEETSLDGVFVVTPKRFGDDRGFFSEVWSRPALAKHGIDTDFVQDNHSKSAQRGTVRGLHFQAPPHAQDKLVRCGAGAVLDVVVDIRKSSSSYGKWLSVELSAENGKQLFVPKGFLHGFSTLTADAELLYKCSDIYAPDCDGSVHFASPSLGIDWQVDASGAVLSDKDAQAVDFAQFVSPFE